MNHIGQKIWDFLPIHKGQVRSWLVATGVVVSLLNLNEISLTATVIGVACLVFGTYLQVICRGHIHQNEILTTSGPFRWVRHPMHLSKLMLDLGFCFIINLWPLTLIYLVFWNYAHWKNRVKEENELIEIFGDRYREYREKVPSFIPWKWPLPEDETSETHFDWTCENLTTGRYLGRAMRYASYPYLFFFCMEVGRWGPSVFRRSRGAAISLCGFVLCYVSYKFLYSIVKYREFPLPRWTFTRTARAGFFLAMVVLLFCMPDNQTAPYALGGVLPGMYSRWALVGAGVLLFLPFVFQGSNEVFRSHRFWYLMEGLTIVLLCISEGYVWLIALPYLYYLPLFIYQTADDTDIQFEHIFGETLSSEASNYYLQHAVLLITGSLVVAQGEVAVLTMSRFLA